MTSAFSLLFSPHLFVRIIDETLFFIFHLNFSSLIFHFSFILHTSDLTVSLDACVAYSSEASLKKVLAFGNKNENNLIFILYFTHLFVPLQRLVSSS